MDATAAAFVFLILNSKSDWSNGVELWFVSLITLPPITLTETQALTQSLTQALTQSHNKNTSANTNTHNITDTDTNINTNNIFANSWI